MELLNSPLLDWSRAQFALTAMYHWLFVPLTLGLGLIMSIMETIYVKTGDEKWKKTAKFWMNLFGVNFAIGVATGLILEFEFGTNWSNYSWLVGDIFGAPLAIEGVLAFFMEATFISIMFFGWVRVSKKMHLASTWLTVTGATLSALWILVANSWMQYPTGTEFNPDTFRVEMNDFWAVALSPFAIAKFFHTVLSSWVLGAAFVCGISGWYLAKKRNVVFAKQSFKVGSVVGLVAILLTVFSGDFSAYMAAQKQPMKLAAMEGLYQGHKGEGLIVMALPNPAKKSYNDGVDPFIFKLEIPKALAALGYHDFDAFVPGITDIIKGGYIQENGEVALSFAEKQARGKIAREALLAYQTAVKDGKKADVEKYKTQLQNNYKYFGYSYFNSPEDTIPRIPEVYWSFHIMIYIGGYLILFFLLATFYSFKDKLDGKKWFLSLSVWTIPLVYICSESGWMVTELGRQPWAIQDILPLKAAVSALSSYAVMITFFLFLILFTALLIAEIRIMLNQIKKGPEAE